MGAFVLSDLIARIQLQNPDLPRAMVDRGVRRVFDVMVETLAQGGRVELRNVGVLETRHRDGGLSRNPKTNVPVLIEPRRAVHWRTGRALSRALNDRAAH